ncbi:MAG: glycerol kinase, partial [Actinobacteria bacterium]|nr:glycerol kinase [Actinomycetota bacterium]
MPRTETLVTVVVAIDAGTTGVRAIAFNQRGLPVTSSYREFTQFFPQPGWVEHDADEIWAAVQLVLAELTTALAAAEETIAAIGITDQRETIVAWNRHTGEPLHRAIVWQDRRTADYCAQLESDGALDRVRSTTGLVLDPYFSGTKAHWLFT